MFYRTYVISIKPGPRWLNTWWHHQMKTFSALLVFYTGNSPVTGDFPTQRPVTRSFDVFHWSASETTVSRSLWRPCNEHRSDLHISGPLWRESIGHRWFPLTTDQRCKTMLLPLSLAWKTLEIPITHVWDAVTFTRCHNNAECPMFCRRHFELHFDSDATDVCCHLSNLQSASTDSNNGVTPNRWQAMTWL